MKPSNVYIFDIGKDVRLYQKNGKHKPNRFVVYTGEGRNMDILETGNDEAALIEKYNIQKNNIFNRRLGRWGPGSKKRDLEPILFKKEKA